MVIKLPNKNKTLYFKYKTGNEIYSVYLLSDNKEIFMGDNKLSFLIEKLKVALENWKTTIKPFNLSGNKVFWILTLGEEGSTITILAGENKSKLNLYFVDENSKIIDIIELSDDEIQNWLQLLKNIT